MARGKKLISEKFRLPKCSFTLRSTKGNADASRNFAAVGRAGVPWLSWAREEAVLQHPVLPLSCRSKNLLKKLIQHAVHYKNIKHTA